MVGVPSICTDRLSMVANQVSVGDLRWVVGADGDLAVAGDFDCDGWLEVASVSSRGDVAVFDGWAGAGQEPVGRIVGHVAGARGVTASAPRSLPRAGRGAHRPASGRRGPGGRPMSRRAGPIVGASAWLAGLAGLGWWLVRLGQGGGGLANPPVADPSTWAAWAEGVGPITAAFALLRLACLAAVVYLIVALLVGVAARLTGRRTLVRLSDAISIGLVRRILNGAVGVGVTTGALAAGATPMLQAAMPRAERGRPPPGIGHAAVPAAWLLGPRRPRWGRCRR